MDPKLQQSWSGLWKRLGLHGTGQAEFADLVLLYSETYRAYHTIEHIRACLAEFYRVTDMSAAHDLVEIALWYHDAIYNTRTHTSEEQSAQLAYQVLTHAGLSSEKAASVRRLILATKHDTVPTEPDEQLLVDIDLSILGESKDRFDEYEQQVRKEYAWVPETQFRSGRAAILQQFLKRPVIYLTRHFQKLYEVRARLNLARSLEQLRAA